MNKMKYEILLQVHEANSVNPAHRRDFHSKTGKIIEYQRGIDELIAAGFLTKSVGSDQLNITLSGVEALEAEQERIRLSDEEARKDAKQEKQQRFENKVAVANVLVPLITYILGILTEHYARILDFITNLFH